MLNMPEKIEGKRIVLVRPHPVTFKMAQEVFAVRENSRKNWEKWLQKMPVTPEEEYNLLSITVKNRWDNGKGFNWLIHDKKTNKVLGLVCLDEFNVSNQYANLGYHLADDAVGQGYVSEAIPLLERVAFENGINRIELRTDEKNKRSIAVAKRNGYHLDGIMREARWSEYFKGFRNWYIFSKLKSEWLKTQKGEKKHAQNAGKNRK